LIAAVVPGGTQALERSEQVEVHHENRRALVPRTSLLGAVVGKAAAGALPVNNHRHLRDLALLCALVPDPFSLAEELMSKDRKRLGSARLLADPWHPGWQLVPSDVLEQGFKPSRSSPADRSPRLQCSRPALNKPVSCSRL